MADRVGQYIDDYRLTRLLGRGSFGEVYLGKHLDDQTLVAVKLLNLNQENLKEFVKEASTTFRLKHAHIIHLLSFGISADDICYLVMDYAPNGTLRQRHPKGTRLPLDTIVSYLSPLASALEYAHDNRVIHCDVKPENVLIGQDGEVLLSDFGIAVIAPIEQSLRTQNMGGTAPYMAPEQIRGKPLPASDQYALGIIAYEWLCGVRPFQGTLVELLDQHRYLQPPPLREKLPDLPPMVEEIILKALSKDPQERFVRVQDFTIALQQVTHIGKPSPALSSSSLPLTLSPRDVSPQQASSKLSSQETLQPLVITNLTPPPATTVSSTAPITPSFSSPPISFPPTSQPVFVPSILPLVRQGPTRRMIILFAGLLLVIIGGSAFLSPPVINSLMKNSSSATDPSITATAAAHAYAAGILRSGVMFGFDPAHTHWNPYEKVLNKTNVSGLKLDWSYATDYDITYSSPAVANGAVYIGSNDHKLYAFDASCRSVCQPLWSYATGSDIISSPAVDNGLVYIGSFDNKLYAFDASCRRDCQPLWTYTADNAVSPPVVANGVVYVGSQDNKLYAFDASCRRACQPLWSYATGSEIWSSPAVANGIVYVGSGDHKLYAFDATCRWDCQPLWFYNTGTNYIISSSPVVTNGLVYVGSEDNKLYAFDAFCRRDCQPLWSYATGGAIVSSPAVANGIVYVGSGDHKLYAFDATCRRACQPLWSYATGSGIYSSPAVANGIVYVGSGDHKLYVFDATCRRACQPLWSYTMGGEIYSSPAVANGIVYVGCADHKLYAFGL